MVQQDEGWPLGLPPLNARIGFTTINRHNSGSISFNTLITASPSSCTDSSSDLDSESTGSFFADKSTTFGSLIGVSSILELSRRSLRGSKTEVLKSKKKGNKSSWSSWLWCLCSRSGLDADMQQNGASLAHFLAEERKAATQTRRNHSLPLYGPDDEFLLAQSQSMVQPNSLFVNGSIAPPPGCLTPSLETERESRGLSHSNGVRSLTQLFTCVCGHATPG